MRRAYRIRWLEPDDARDVAALEARVHEPRHRIGAEVVRGQLEIACDEGRNLSLGLYLGRKLVGFLLAFHARDRREICDFFEAPLPEGLDPDERTLYVADFVVHPRHRRASTLLATKLRDIVVARADLRDLPDLRIDAFSTEEYAEFWSARHAFFARMGVQLATSYPFHDPQLGTRMYWLSFRRVRGDAVPVPAVPVLKDVRALDTQGRLTAGYLDSAVDWACLEGDWNRLLAVSPDVPPHLTFRYVHDWWTHVGIVAADPCIVVGMRDGVPVVIAPMQIGPGFRVTRTVGLRLFGGRQVQGLSLLGSTQDEEALAAVTRYIADMARCNGYHLSSAESRRLLRRGPTAQGALPVELQEQLEGLGPRFASSGFSLASPGAGADLATALERIAEIETEAGVPGVTASAAIWGFFRRLVQDSAAGLHIALLRDGSRNVAGLVGVVGNGSFVPLLAACRRDYEGQGAEAYLRLRVAQELFAMGTAHNLTYATQDPLVPARRGFRSRLARRAGAAGELLHLLLHPRALIASLRPAFRPASIAPSLSSPVTARVVRKK